MNQAARPKLPPLPHFSEALREKAVAIDPKWCVRRCPCVGWGLPFWSSCCIRPQACDIKALTCHANAVGLGAVSFQCEGEKEMVEVRAAVQHGVLEALEV